MLVAAMTSVQLPEYWLCRAAVATVMIVFSTALFLLMMALQRRARRLATHR